MHSSKIVLVVALALAVLAPNALADTRRIEHGAFCTGLFTPTTASYNRSQNGITNSTSGSGNNFTFVCPIYRQNTTNTNGLTGLTVDYNTGNGGGSCTAFSIGFTGNILKSVSLNLKTGSNLNTFDDFPA